MIEAGLLTAVGIIWILCYFDLRKVAGMAVWIDIATFIALPILFIGTFAGMVTGFLGGICVSVFLKVLIKRGDVLKPKLIRFEGEYYPRLRWVKV